MSPDPRLADLSAWLRKYLPGGSERLVPASGDASFRRYFRVYGADESSLIAMDAPPPLENIQPFLDVARLLADAGVTVPKIHAADPECGFALLSDLGHIRYQDELSAETADRLYGDAVRALVRFQGNIDIGRCGRPAYDEALLYRELQIFREWFLEGLLGLELQPEEFTLLERTWSRLIVSALEQPKVFVHRDYHSRNLMRCATGNPGILDFQDAVVGPIAYDLVSLLRDCYVCWPEAWVERWVGDYLDRATERAVITRADAGRFDRWFDLMGMQRHLKAAGIFSRLKLRDGKAGYLADIPRTLGYVARVSHRYPELSDFAAFLEDTLATRCTNEVFA